MTNLTRHMATLDDTLIDCGKHAAFRAAADAGPVAVGSRSGLLHVLHYAEIDALAHDARLAGVGLSLFDLMGIEDGDLRRWYGQLMFTNDGDVHNRLRRLVSRAFTPRSVEALRDTAATLASAAINDIAQAGKGDVVEALTNVPIRVICRLLGIPDEAIGDFWQWADALSPAFVMMSPVQIDAASAAITPFLDYVEQLIATRSADRRDDLTSHLIETEEAGDRLTHEELVAMVGNLIVGGHDTTASQIGCTLFTLLGHPDVVATVRQTPELLPSVVNETIRFEPSLHGIPRRLTEDMVIGGHALPAGSTVMLSTGTANREPAVWGDPETVRPDRFASPDTPKLLSFGAGPHYCLGAALARITLEEVVRAFVRVRFEASTELDGITWQKVLGRSPATLPVRVTAA